MADHGRDRAVIIRPALYFLVLALLMLSSAPPAFTETLYSRKADLPPLLFTYANLQRVLDGAAGLISKANKDRGGLSEDVASETLFLSDGTVGIRTSGHRLLPAQAGLRKAASGFSYIYNAPDAIVTDVEIVFSGSSRTLYVAGYASEKVEEIFAALEGSLLNAGAGGIGMNEKIKKFLAKFLLFTLILSALYCLKKKRPKALGMPLFSLAGLVLLHTLSFELHPAFTVFSGKPPLAVSYGPQISLAVLALVIAGIPLSYFLPERTDKGR